MFNIRQQGVTIPDSQINPRSVGSEQTVINAVEVKFVAVEYYDDRGARRQEVLLQLGEDYYAPPDSAAWTKALKPVSKWLSTGIRSKSSVAADQVPSKDEVPVI